MKWSANTWVLVILSVVLILVGVDLGRRTLAVTKAQVEEGKPPTTDPDFKVGDTAPDFELADRTGKKHKLSELAGKDTLLSFLCGCSSCRQVQTYTGVLTRKLGPKAPKLVAVTSADPAAEESWFRDTGVKEALLYERGPGPTPVMDKYKGHPCPRVFRLGPDRKVEWIGPSPSPGMPMTQVGMQLAENLGFKTPMGGNPNGLPLPEMATDNAPVPAPGKSTPSPIPVAHPDLPPYALPSKG